MAAAMKKGRNHDQLHPCLQNTAVSKKFGIEGKRLLTPDDDYEALKDFHSQDEGMGFRGAQRDDTRIIQQARSLVQMSRMAGFFCLPAADEKSFKSFLL